RDLGLAVAPAAGVHLFPGIAGFVGGDHVAALLALETRGLEGSLLLLDIGTNTEISLLHAGAILTVSCPSGPALEGGEITWGMQAAAGAIERVALHQDLLELQTIDGAPAEGICGSGVLDTVAALLGAGIINHRGRLQPGYARVRDSGQVREFVLVAEVWVIMAFIGAVRAHHLVGSAFTSGLLVTVVMAYLLRFTWLHKTQEPVLAYLVALILGQVTILAITLTALAREFEFHARWNFDWWPYAKRYPAMAASGFFYYLALWISSFVYWFAPGPGRELMRGEYMWAFPPIDLAAFFAQMSILPAVIVFFVHTETDFYEDYRGFYNAVLARKGLDIVIQRRQKLTQNLKDALYSIMVVQLVCTLGALVFAPFLEGFYDFDGYKIHLFRVCALGAAPQAMLLFVLVITYYFQFYRQALITSLVTFVVAFLTALWTLQAGMEWYGLGLFAGCSTGLVLGTLWLFKKLQNLEYLTFMSQPVAEEIPYQSDMMTDGRFGTYTRKDGQMIEAQPQRGGKKAR
ncbi:DUF4445 domain-containing protein, partial [bacterium CPR1]|nr:DUF4445 domain-containing protein [bacterium CPR1]